MGMASIRTGLVRSAGMSDGWVLPTLRDVPDVRVFEQPRLDLVLEGAPGTISLRSFLRALDDARAVIEGVDVSITHRSDPVVEWYIQDLRTSSLAATLVGKPRRGRGAIEYTPQRADEIAAMFVRGLRDVELKPVVPPAFSEPSMRRLKQLGNVIGQSDAKGFRATMLSRPRPDLVTANEDLSKLPVLEARLTKRTAANAKEALHPRYQALGSVMGRLDVINLHRSQQFTIYDEIDRRPVKGSFTTELLRYVKEALGRRVLATGLISRNGTNQMVSLLVDELEILPQENQLPSVADLVGSDPGFTSGVPADEWVRRVREA